MSITPLSGLGQQPQPQTVQSASTRLQAVIANLASNNDAQASGNDVESVSQAGQLQAQTSGLKQASSNILQALSLTEVAGNGASQAQELLGQMQSLVSEANVPSLDLNSRKSLNQQFQQLSGSLNQLAQTTGFNGQNLLDGSLSGTQSLTLDSLLPADSSTGSGIALSLPSVSGASLLGQGNTNILSTEAAAQAFGVVGGALDTVNAASANISAFQQAVEFAGAHVDTALANHDAATATLSDTDLAGANAAFSPASVQQNAALSLAAQGNLLNPSLMQLVS